MLSRPMALLACPRCRREISDRSPACVGCGLATRRACEDCASLVSVFSAACRNCGCPVSVVGETRPADAGSSGVSAVAAPAKGTSPVQITDAASAAAAAGLAPNYYQRAGSAAFLSGGEVFVVGGRAGAILYPLAVAFTSKAPVGAYWFGEVAVSAIGAFLFGGLVCWIVSTTARIARSVTAQAMVSMLGAVAPLALRTFLGQW